MYISYSNEKVRKIFERIERYEEVDKLRFLIYLFEGLINEQINNKNEINPNLNEDDDLIVFSLDMVKFNNNFSYNYLVELIKLYNGLVDNLEKAFIFSSFALGISYDSIKEILSEFEKLDYNDKLDVFKELFIRIDNNSFYKENYNSLVLSTNGYEIARLIDNLKI